MNDFKASADHTLTQVSTIAALLNGAYDGQVSVGELLKHGDFGLGTFDHLDGEMIVLEGEVYQVLHNGQVVRPELTATTPFAAVSFFEMAEQHALPNGVTFDSFAAGEDRLLPSLNMFFAIRIDGRFERITARSVPRQEKPYPDLAKVASQQSIFELENVSGTIAGFRCPGYAEGINVPGYHLHFISDDRRSGGHVLEFTAASAVASADYDNAFAMMLPDSAVFYDSHLEIGQHDMLRGIERGVPAHAHVALAR